MTSKAQRESLLTEFTSITSSSTTDATLFLKLTSWRLEPALNAFYNDPNAVRRAELNSTGTGGGGKSVVKNLENMWGRYKDPAIPTESDINGTILYCEDLAVEPEDVVMLAVAWLTKAPTMGKFGKKEWIEAWGGLRRDTIELQRAHIMTLRKELEGAETFRKVYNFTFDYAKTEGQRSMQLESATELWNLLIPLDPAIKEFSTEHLGWFTEFLVSRGSKSVSKDTWCLFLEFCRGADPTFSKHDEEAAWPSIIDDFVEHAREKIAVQGGPPGV